MDNTPFIENRKALVAEYYGLDISTIDKLACIPYGDLRKKLCREYKVDPYIFRTMLDYTRYFEAALLLNALTDSGVQIVGLKVLDFGCLVCDYGISFARLGAAVKAYDKAYALPFVNFRFAKANLPIQIITYPQPHPKVVSGQDLLIFGEVLEHLADPFSLLMECWTNCVKYLFTSCYPFGSDAYFDSPGHHKLAKAQRNECLGLLRQKYSEKVLAKSARLWTRNDSNC